MMVDGVVWIGLNRIPRAPSTRDKEMWQPSDAVVKVACRLRGNEPAALAEYQLELLGALRPNKLPLLSR